MPIPYQKSFCRQAGNFLFFFLQKTGRWHVRMLTWTEIPTQKHSTYGEIICQKKKKKMYFAIQNLCISEAKETFKLENFTLCISLSLIELVKSCFGMCVCYLHIDLRYFSPFTAQILLFEVLSSEKSFNNYCISLKFLAHPQFFLSWVKAQDFKNKLN